MTRRSEAQLQANRAHALLNRAVLKGDVVRQPCEVCGEAAEAHHDDYSLPLDVRWLCPSHHRRWHKDNPTGIKWTGNESVISTRVEGWLAEAIRAMARENGNTVSAEIRLAVIESLSEDAA